jgi:hypothetical protein
MPMNSTYTGSYTSEQYLAEEIVLPVFSLFDQPVYRGHWIHGWEAGPQGIRRGSRCAAYG